MIRNEYLAAAVILALIGAVTALTWVDKLTGEAAVGFFGALVGAALGVGAAAAGLRAGSRSVS